MQHSAALDRDFGQVITLHQRITRADRALIARWLRAGSRMGLHDVQIGRETSGGPADHALVWVRENPDPVYMVRAEAMAWHVIDLLRAHHLGRFASLPAALNHIRPVLKLDHAA